MTVIHYSLPQDLVKDTSQDVANLQELKINDIHNNINDIKCVTIQSMLAKSNPAPDLILKEKSNRATSPPLSPSLAIGIVEFGS